jgi:hypothetical protein
MCRSLIGSPIAKNAICKTVKGCRRLAGGASSDDQVSESLNKKINEITDVSLPELMLSLYMVYPLLCYPSWASGYAEYFH